MAFLFLETSPHENSSVLQNAANTLKVLLLLAGLIWTMLMVRGAFMSFSCEMVFSSVVGVWSSIRCVLSSPLYICIIINSMVLLIAATSSFHHHHHPPPPPLEKSSPSTTENIIPMWRLGISQDPTGRDCDHDHEDEHNESVAKAYIPSSHYNGKVSSDEIKKTKAKEREEEEREKKEEDDTIEATWEAITGSKTIFVVVSSDEIKKTEANEKEKAESEKEDEDDTMEATWEAITGAKTKELKKSETFHEEPSQSTSTWKDLRKSETFNESVSIRRVGGLMRDPSIGIDEFNQQVEAFIKKFNQNMRLQRQESDQRFMDMIKKGL